MSARPYRRIGPGEYRTNDQRFQIVNGYLGALGWHVVENKGDHAELVDTGGGLSSALVAQAFVEKLYRLEGSIVSRAAENVLRREETP